MRKSLTIGEAAARLGVEVDTLRRLEKDGAIRAERTQGGHRRFDEGEVGRFARARNGRRAARAVPMPHARRPPPQAVGHPVGRVAPPLRVTPATMVSQASEDQPTGFDFEDDSSYEAPARQAKADRFDRNRLESIKSYGLARIPFGVPATWRARVIADLERFVTPTQFPNHVSQWEANNLVSARVEEVLGPYREHEARDRDRRDVDERARWRLVTLRAHGTSYAIKETTDWDWAAQSEARREVARELDAKAQAGWSERDVEKLVDEILDDWVDEDDENEDDGGTDEDEGADWIEEQ